LRRTQRNSIYAGSVKLRGYARSVKLRIQFVCSFIALPALLALSFDIFRRQLSV
jgi:hypothetical protein